MKSLIQIPDPNESWAQVELFRWQYGVLPESGDFRPLDVSIGIRNMAEALIKGCKKSASTEDKANMPAPFNVYEVMKYAAKLIEQKS